MLTTETFFEMIGEFKHEYKFEKLIFFFAFLKYIVKVNNRFLILYLS